MVEKPVPAGTSDEALVPDRNEIPLPVLPRLLWLAIVLFVAFAVLGFYSQWIHERSRPFALLSRWESGPYGVLAGSLVGSTFVAIMDSVPVLSALVMLWIAFLSPRWSDRMLWSAAMIFTVAELSIDVAYLFHHNVGNEVRHSYPRSSAVVGLIACASWLLIIPESTLPTWMKRSLSTICMLAVAVIVLYPLIDAYTRVVDTAGAVLFAAALFALGIYVAGLVGVDVLSPLRHLRMRQKPPNVEEPR